MKNQTEVLGYYVEVRILGYSGWQPAVEVRSERVVINKRGVPCTERSSMMVSKMQHCDDVDNVSFEPEYGMTITGATQLSNGRGNFIHTEDNKTVVMLQTKVVFPNKELVKLFVNKCLQVTLGEMPPFRINHY